MSARYAATCRIFDVLVGAEDILERLIGDHTDDRAPQLLVARIALRAAQDMLNELPHEDEGDTQEAPPAAPVTRLRPV